MATLRQLNKLKNLDKFSQSNSVFLSGLSWITGTQQIKQYMEAFGKVTNIFMFMDDYRGLHLGNAVVKFAEEGSVNKVLQEKEHSIDNKTISIKPHNPKGPTNRSESKKDEREVENEWHL